MGMHGGDIYRNRVEMDFSVNVNPLGIPEAVGAALHGAVEKCGSYPDMEAQELKRSVGKMLGIAEECLLFGNGASELFMAVIHGLRPKKTVIPVPSFYGYEYAAEAGGGEVIYYEMREEDGFGLTEDFYTVLTEDTELLFLANPNNPTGKRMEREEIRRLLSHCRERGIYVVLDECFIEFCGRECSMLPETGQFENLILVRAFTKIFAIPGVRLGYLACGSRMLLDRIRRQLPEWNLSCFAQAAGCACAGEGNFMKKTADYVRKEREFLEGEMRRMGLCVFPSEANFIFLRSEVLLYERLLERGILIRDCGNFRGVGGGFYRIAVRGRGENERLVEAVGRVCGRPASI